MGTFLKRASPWHLAFACLVLAPVVLGVESSDYLESLKDDEEPLGPKEAVTEYPNGVNVIPGEADIHYPIYAKIPKSSFNCFGRRPGFYANTDLRCQVWHICDESGVQQDFLCTNGTIYSQDKRVCDWWYNVNCDPEEVNRGYAQNEELYKGPPPKKSTAVDDEESNDLPPPPPRKSAQSQPQPQQRRPQQQQPRPQQEFQRSEAQHQSRQEVQPTARRIGNDERPYTVEDRNPSAVQSRPPPPPSRPAGNPTQSGTPEKKRVIVLRLPGPLPPGATIPPHILMEYAESVLAAERAGKAPPTGLHDLKNSQSSHRQQPQQQQRPRPPPSTTQSPPPPPPPTPQQPLAQGPPAPKPRGPILPYTPRPFSTFLEQASKFNGQTKTQQRPNAEQNYNRPEQTPPPTQRPTQPSTPPTQRTTQQQQSHNRVQEQNNFRSSQAPQRPTADPEYQQRQQPEQENYDRPQEQPQRPVQEQQNVRQSQPPPPSSQRPTDKPYCDPESGQYCGEAAYERQREERQQQSQRPQERPQQRPQEEQRQQPQRPQERPQQKPQEEQRQQPQRPQERPQQQQRPSEEPRPQAQRPQERPQQRPQEEHQQPQRPQERPQQRPQEDQRQQQRQQYEEPRQQPQRPQERPQQRPQEESRQQQQNYERPQEQEYQQRPQQSQPRPTSRPAPPPLDDAPLPEKKVPVKAPSHKSHVAPDSPHKKFRHSTPRKTSNVVFAPKSQALDEEDGGFVVEESRRPAYPFQFNAFQQPASVIQPQQTSSAEKESVHSKAVINPFQGKPRRQKQRPQTDYIPEVVTTGVPEEATTVRRLAVVAKQTLKIKDPRPQHQSRPVAPEVPFTEDFPRDAYEAVKVGSNYRQSTEAPTTFRTVSRSTTTTATQRLSTRPSTTTTTTTTSTTEATTPEQVVEQYSTIQPVRRVIKKKKLRPITTTTTEHYDGQYVPNEPEHFFPSTEPSAFSKISEDLGLDIYGRGPDDDEEEELIRAAQLYLQASESYGKRKRL